MTIPNKIIDQIFKRFEAKSFWFEEGGDYYFCRRFLAESLREVLNELVYLPKNEKNNKIADMLSALKEKLE